MVHRHHLDHLLAAAADDVLLADDVDHGVAQYVAELVHGGQLAAAAEPRIDGQHAAVAHRRLQQQLAEIAGEDLNRVGLGPFGQLAAHLTLQAGHQQTVQGVPQAAAQEFGVRMIRADQAVLGPLVHGLHVGFDLDSQDLRSFAAIDGQQPVRRDLGQRFLVPEIILERLDLFFAFPLLGFLAALGGQLLDR